MKYNEFRALSAILENNGSSIEEFKGDDFLFEAEEDLDTGGDKLKQATSPRFALARKKITNNAKKYLKLANEKLIDKYANTHLENLKEITNKAAGLKKDGRNPEEIIGALQEVGQQSMATNQKMWKQVEAGLDKLEQSFTKRVDQLKNNDKLNDKSKIKLEIYWTLLLAQVKGKLYGNIIKKQQGFIENVAESNPELKDFMNKIGGGDNLNVEMQKVKKQADEEKRKFQEADKQAEGAEAEGEAKAEPQVGEKYKVTTKSGEAVVEIMEIGKDGGALGAGMVKVKDAKNKVHPISVKKLTDKVEAPAAPAATTTA